jgi:hypothetical protein
MRIGLATILLLTGLALQPALAGGWGYHDVRRAPPPPPPRQYRAPEPPRPPPGAYAAPRYPPMTPDQIRQRVGGGRILAINPAENGLRVRVLKDGEVRSVEVPGAAYAPGPGYPPPPPPGYAYPPGYPPGR